MAYTPLKSVKEWLEALLDAVQSIRVLGAVRWVLADLRVSVVALPPVTITSGTVTTVGTVTNQAQLWLYLTNNLVQAQMNTAVSVGNINNISITP